eukprot:6179576-Pleurochrysis_carterae.AAC.1
MTQASAPLLRACLSRPAPCQRRATHHEPKQGSPRSGKKRNARQTQHTIATNASVKRAGAGEGAAWPWSGSSRGIRGVNLAQ